MHSPTDRQGRITRACVDARYDELREALKSAPPPTRRMRERAAQACAYVVRPEVPRWSPLPFLGGLAVLALVVVMLAVGGCVPVEAIDHAREQHAIMAGHALDESLPLPARQIGADAMRAMSTQHRVLAGEHLVSPELPPELAPAAAIDDGPR